MKIRGFEVVICAYLWFILANLLDILSSVGRLEANPLMQQDGLLIFDLGKAIKVKLLFLCYYLTLSLYTYCLASFVSRRLAPYAAAIIPIVSTYALIQVAFQNVL